jgi:hypothetical protein
MISRQTLVVVLIQGNHATTYKVTFNARGASSSPTLVNFTQHQQTQLSPLIRHSIELMSYKIIDDHSTSCFY